MSVKPGKTGKSCDRPLNAQPTKTIGPREMSDRRSIRCALVSRQHRSAQKKSAGSPADGTVDEKLPPASVDPLN
jgi:hypothetical protein